MQHQEGVHAAPGGCSCSTRRGFMQHQEGVPTKSTDTNVDYSSTWVYCRCSLGAICGLRSSSFSLVPRPKLIHVHNTMYVAHVLYCKR